MKYLKILVILLLLTGCTKTKELSKTYEKMQIGDKSISGYALDLRIDIKKDESIINQQLRITNYNNTDYSIIRPSMKFLEKIESKIYYVKGNKTYTKDELGKTKETDEKIYFPNPNIFIEGLKNVSKVTEKSKEKIVDVDYNVYKVNIKKDFIKKLLNEIKQEIELEELEATIYIDEDGYLYKTIYENKDIKINANYYAIDNVKEIKIEN